MTAIGAGFLPLDAQIFDRTLGEAMADIARHRYPRDTAKHIARAWGIDASTATNVVRGHCSERTLTKAFKAEGWPLIAALGAVVTGETYQEHEERKLQTIIEEGVRAHDQLRSLRARRAALESSAGRALDAFDREAADESRGGERRTWRAPDQPSHKPPRRKSSARKA